MNRWWNIKGSNLEPIGYEPNALTICANVPKSLVPARPIKIDLAPYLFPLLLVHALKAKRQRNCRGKWTILYRLLINAIYIVEILLAKIAPAIRAPNLAKFPLFAHTRATFRFRIYIQTRASRRQISQQPPRQSPHHTQSAANNRKAYNNCHPTAPRQAIVSSAPCRAILSATRQPASLPSPEPRLFSDYTTPRRPLSIPI